MFISFAIIKGQTPTPDAVPGPFLGLGLFTLLLCVILFFLKLPNINEEEQAAEAGHNTQYKDSVFKYPHVYFGALGIFMYMGLEIGIPSMLPYKIDNATEYLPLYWGGMMVGRFAGAAILNKFKPRAILMACLLGGLVCVGISFVLSGMASAYALLAAGLFHSVMWPLIFNLGLQELGPHTKAASGIINMGVIGAATLPLLMGWVVDISSVGTALCLMFVYYAYEIWFCNWGSKIGISGKG